jgi:hypothetical protein
MSGTAVIDATTNTWGIELTPGTAAIDDFMSFSTRSYLINDDNLSLRQKLLTVISKSGTAGGTASEFNMTLSATYYDNTDTALSTAFIGTVYDTGTWTSMSGTTTPGGSAIAASARYVDIEYKLTATAAVTGSAKVTIKSCLLQTSSGTGASQSFLVTETFTSSGSWVTPTGVTNLVALAGLGAGGGGASGGVIFSETELSIQIVGSGGGGGAQYIIMRDVPVSGTISVGIGAGGAGGSAVTATKAAAGTANVISRGTAGANGGDTTFGTLLTIGGGKGGVSGTAAVSGTSLPAISATNGAGGAIGTALPTVFGFQVGATTMVGGSGGREQASSNTQPGTEGGDGNGAYDFPYIGSGLGSNGGSPSSSGTANGGSLLVTSRNGGTAVTIATLGGGGGGGGGISGTSVAQPGSNGSSSSGYGTGGCAGGGIRLKDQSANPTAGTLAVTGGNGGNATDGLGGGGGAGGGAVITASTASLYNARNLAGTSGAGGSGASGEITIAWIA